MKERLNLKNRVLYKWIISYILVFLIPLLLCTFLFQTIDASFKKQIVSSNNLILDSIRSELESFMDFSRKISY